MTRKTRTRTRATKITAEPARAAAPERIGGIVVPFPAAAVRPARPAPQAGEARGEILLFLGVRYQRLAS